MVFMNNKKYISQIILLLIVFFHFNVSAQTRESAFQLNERLGRGINMGNCFEAPSETEWGNPWKPEYFRIMSELGFKHVRIPIRWEPTARTSWTAPYTITTSFMGRIKQVVDTALKYKLHVIINMHHHDSLFANPDKQKARFLSQWNQIATTFKNYPDSLLFEVLNEPHGNLTAAKWNTFFTDALAEIRKTNPTRCVVLGSAEWGGLGGLNQLQVPPDENLILTIHNYNPFQFTHQGAEWSGPEAQNWLGTKWNDTEAERQTVESEFRQAIQFSKDQHIPIHIGEFGAYSKADLASRVKWTNFLARWFEQQKFSWAYWEFSAGFGIYNPTTKQILSSLSDALVKNPMPPAVPIQAILLYKSNFSSGPDGWSVSFSNGAAGTWNRNEGKMNVSVSNGGTEGWHVQAIKGGISLQKDKTYRVSFTTKAAANRSATVYLGMPVSPWSAFSGYNTVNMTTTETTSTFTFVMTGSSLTNARLVFDLGKSTVGFSVYDIVIEEIRLVNTPVKTQGFRLKFYPNPVREELYIDQLPSKADFSICDLSGRCVKTGKLNPGNNRVDTGMLPAGLWILSVRTGSEQMNFRFVKK
jgi:aryl-phospho-beta-D-glucosidase BglC (GH1 family)